MEGEKERKEKEEAVASYCISFYDVSSLFTMDVILLLLLVQDSWPEAAHHWPVLGRRGLNRSLVWTGINLVSIFEVARKQMFGHYIVHAHYYVERSLS